MKKMSKTVLFFGSGPVAAESLRQYLAWGQVEAIITKTTTQHQLQAISPHTPVFCANNKADLAQLFAEQSFGSPVGLLIDYGVMITSAIINHFQHGIVNSHFSLLPEWRGADPINFAILSGQTKTGVSLMQLVSAMDEGPLFGQAQLSINHQTSPQLTSSLINLSDRLLRQHLPQIISGKLSVTAQDLSHPTTYARQLTKQDANLDFNKPAAVLAREVRAFISWPKSHTKLAGLDIIITKAHAQTSSLADEQPTAALDIGQPTVIGKLLGLRAKDGFLIIDELKPAGKPQMSASSFLAGYGSRL